jgi:hypothetical protein
MLPRGVRTGLFHAVVGLGLAACGGTTATSKDAGSGVVPRDAASTEATMPALDGASLDVFSVDALASPDASADAADAVAALDAGFEAAPDVWMIPPVQ